MLRLDDGRILEGFLDLAFREASGQWVVVDFKTATPGSAEAGSYDRQLGWYAYALSQIENAKVEAWVLSI